MSPTDPNLDLFEEFLARGWVPNYDQHPESAPLELVMIEPRNHNHLLPAIQNMSCLLPNAMLTVFHSPENKEVLESEVYANGHNHVRLIPLFTQNINRGIYNKLITDPDFWELCKAPKVLLFQVDSGLRHNSILRFMEYDYVGAPWPWNVYHPNPAVCVGNGGFSLRNRGFMEDISRKYGNTQHIEAEDVFFAKYTYHWPNANVPSKEVASQFSVEHIPYEDPMGFHQAWGFHQRPMGERWMRTGLDPIRKEKTVTIKDAWIEFSDGYIQSSSELVPWLNLGIGSAGLRIPKHTRISVLEGISRPNATPSLVIQTDHQPQQHRIPISSDSYRVNDTVLMYDCVDTIAHGEQAP